MPPLVLLLFKYCSNDLLFVYPETTVTGYDTVSCCGVLQSTNSVMYVSCDEIFSYLTFSLVKVTS